MTGTHTFIVICEGKGDLDVVESLTKRVLEELAEWVTPTFRGLEANEAYSSWAGVRQRSREVPLPRHSGFKGDAWSGDAETAWRALYLASLAKAESAKAVILLRDSDDAESAAEKRAALRAAVRAFRRSDPSLAVAFGLAEQKIEAWLLASIEVTSLQRAAVEREGLGFDPITNPQRLTAKDPQAKNSAKRVLAQLMSMQQALESLRTAPLDRLVRNGEKAGLQAFLCDIRLGLGPQIVGHIPDTGWCRRAEHSREE